MISDKVLPRNRSLVTPSGGITATIGSWLHHLGSFAASIFIVKKKRDPRRPLAPGSGRSRQAQPTLRERTELTQLRAENRRLRAQLDALERHKTD